ncbi:MAG TPA: hypothetical protein PKH65_05480 [Bacteroidia bacterium]|nr:hypothetical protein [Bacteroidia bacterium]HNT80114.1 hypothetical protein [Bacteroidia bacterium]
MSEFDWPDDPYLFDQTKDQIIKDFQLGAVAIDIAPDIKTWHQLAEFLEPILLQLHSKKPETLLAVLYRFDIMKIQFDERFNTLQGSIGHKLAFVIIQRAFSKVMSRRSRS